MLKTFKVILLSLALAASSYGHLLAAHRGDAGSKVIQQRMHVTRGEVTMQLGALAWPRGLGSANSELRFDVNTESDFGALVLDDQIRALLPGSMSLVPNGARVLGGAFDQMVVERLPYGSEGELVVRDGVTGPVLFTIEGQQNDYDPHGETLKLSGGRMILSEGHAARLGNRTNAGRVAGKISISLNLRPVEVAEMVDGKVVSTSLPAGPESGTVPGPDVVVGDLIGLAQFGSVGTQVGLAVGTDSCNFGTEDLHWNANPDNDHPVIPQNLYRMSGGASNDERFEQIGQSNVKHAFLALAQNLCGLGCNGVSGHLLGSGCSDPYSAADNAGPNLGSRAWINPFTGEFPRGDSFTPANNHSGHPHNGVSHRILVEAADLNPAQNAGATYYAEAQYVTRHEYDWCQTHPGQCNMYNNVSYRRYSIAGTTTFSFGPVGTTVRAQPAINAWTGATLVQIQPDPGNDGIGFVAYKVTNPSAGVWHYEYAVYNENLDRAIQSFSVPVGAGATLSNAGFHAPPQHPGWFQNGTVDNAGYSSTPWTNQQSGGAMVWNTETIAQNPNANAIRWGTLYNFRFDSNRPPQNVMATVGFFKTGAPITVAVQGPSAAPVMTVMVSGRLLTSGGNPVRGMIVVMSDQLGGDVRYSFSNSQGHYIFGNVLPGVTYTISVSSKRYLFNPVTLPVNGNLTNVDLVAQPN